MKKLEVSMEAEMPCKMGTKKRSKGLQDTASETTESNKNDKACMHRGSSQIHEKAFGSHSTKKSCKGRLRCIRSIYRTRIVTFANDSRISNGRHCETI